MAHLTPTGYWQLRAGVPLSTGDITVIPQSQALLVSWAARGVVWNRPVAILVEQGGRTSRIPIHDVTCIARLGILGLGLICAVMISIAAARRKEASP